MDELDKDNEIEEMSAEANAVVIKKDNDAEGYENLVDNTKIIKVRVEDEMKKSFISYAMAVNVSRAIPDVRDGLKPVHRRILYAMNELGLSNDKPHRKCARIVGDVLGKYHPHGDSAVYDALVRLAQPFSIRMPLVDGHGNFGSVDGDPAAAQRYTEARLSRIASELLRDIEKKTVDYYPNFDDTLEQPCVLPSRYPNLLVNGSDGIAVGMATSIPPHNLGEVIDGTIALIDNPEFTSDDLMEYIPAPDFPTAGLIMAKEAVKQAYRTGRGGIVMRARCEIEENSQGRQRIIVTELPYQVNKANLIKTIVELVRDKKIEGISDIRDESDRKGMRIVIEVKRDNNAQIVLNSLYKHSNLQVSTGITFLALVDGYPRILSLRDMLSHYIDHQKDIVVRRTKFDLEKAEEREHILCGLVIALDNIDEVIKIIRSSQDNAEAMDRLMKSFRLSEKQANAILEMRLRRLAALEAEKIKSELSEIEKLIIYYKKILANPQMVLDIIKEELTEIKNKYADPRRSEISYDASDINIEDLIAREDIVVSMTHAGYVKRMALSEYRSQRRGGVGVTGHKAKDEDFVESMYLTNTHTDLLFFTNKGKVYRLKGYELPEGAGSARGRAIINLLQLEQGEKVTAFLPRPAEAEGYLLLATKKAYIKKTDIKEFDLIRKVGKIAISLRDDDELISAQHTTGDDEIIVASSDGKCIRFNERNVRAMGRTAGGVRSMKVESGRRVVDMAVIKPDCEILTISSKGFGKRSSVEDYRLQSRAGKGIKAGVFTEETGNLVNLKPIRLDEDIMIVTDNGVVIRVPAEEVRVIGRATKGVRIMRIKSRCNVTGVAVVPHEDEINTAEEATEETAKEKPND